MPPAQTLMALALTVRLLLELLERIVLVMLHPPCSEYTSVTSVGSFKTAVALGPVWFPKTLVGNQENVPGNGEAAEAPKVTVAGLQLGGEVCVTVRDWDALKNGFRIFRVSLKSQLFGSMMLTM